MNKLEIPNGTVYGKLTVLGDGKTLIIPSGQINRTLKCECECGTIKDFRVSHLTRGKSTSCGCSLKKLNGESTTPIGKLYHGIKSRCSDYHSESHLYFDRGIEMCEEWKNDFLVFKAFCLKNGYKPGLQIDRIENDKGYSPDNCRFVTSKVNCNNRSNTFKVIYKGKERSLQLLLEELNYPNKPNTVRRRILNGWETEKAIFKKPANNYSARKKEILQSKN